MILPPSSNTFKQLIKEGLLEPERVTKGPLFYTEKYPFHSKNLYSISYKPVNSFEQKDKELVNLIKLYKEK